MVFDIIIVAIVVLAVFRGFRKGLISSAITLLSTIVALLVALKISQVVLKFFEKESSLIDLLVKRIKEADLDKVMDKVEHSELITTAGDSLKGIFPSGLINTQQTNEDIAMMIIYLIGFFIIFGILKLLITLILSPAKLFSKVPIIHEIDKVGGLLFGFILGLFDVLMLLALLIPIINITHNALLIQALDQSYLGKQLFENNYLLFMVKEIQNFLK